MSTKVLRISPIAYRILRDHATGLGTTMTNLLDSILEEYYGIEPNDVEDEDEEVGEGVGKATLNPRGYRIGFSQIVSFDTNMKKLVPGCYEEEEKRRKKKTK